MLKPRTSATCTFIALLFLAGSVLGAACLHVDESEFDFGNVPQDVRISHVFWLKSIGDDSLEIVNVIPGCGCTRAPLDKNRIAAGDSARMEIIFNTRGYAGKVHKSPRILTNEKGKEIRIHFMATVTTEPEKTHPVVVRPAILDISPAGQESSCRIEFAVANVSEQNLKIRLVDWPRNLCDVKLPARVAAGQSGTGIVLVREEAAASAFETSFTFEADDKDKTRFTVPITYTRQIHGKR